MSEPEQVPGMVTVPRWDAAGNFTVAAVPADSEEARRAAVTAPLTPDTAAQMEQASRWRQIQREAGFGDVLEGMAREGGLAWARGAMAATPVMPWLGAAGYGVSRALEPGSDDSYLRFEAFRQQHPFLSMLPGAVHDIAGAILSGGLSGAGEAAGQALAARMGGGIGARILGGGVGAAIDGGTQAMLQAVQESGIQGTPLDAEQLMAAGGAGALLGGGAGLLFGPFMEVPGSPAAARRVASATAATDGEAMLRRAQLVGRQGQFLPAEAGESNLLTRGGSMVSRIDEGELREHQAFHDLPSQVPQTVRAGEELADSLETAIRRSDSELQAVLGDGAARERHLRDVARFGQQQTGVSDDVVARHAHDMLQDLDRQLTQARQAPLGLDEAGALALAEVGNIVADTRRSLNLAGATPDVLENTGRLAEHVVPRLDAMLQRVRAVTPGNFSEGIAHVEGQVRGVLTNEGVFGRAAQVYRLVDDALSPGHNLRNGGVGWRLAQQRINQRLRESGTGGGHLAISGSRLRKLFAPLEGGDTSIRQDLQDAYGAYASAARAAEGLTGRSFSHLDDLWGDVGERAAVTDLRARAVASGQRLTSRERANAGLFAGAGISGVGLGAFAGGMLGGPVGAVLGTGAGLAFAALSHPVGTMSLLSHMGQLVRGQGARLEGAVTRMRGAVRTGRLAQRIRRGAPAVPVVLARMGTRRTRVAEYQRVTRHLQDLAGNPEALQHALETLYGPVANGVDSGLADHMSVSGVRMVQYLTASLPPVDAPEVTMFPEEQRLQPSDGEINDFLLKYRVALDPVSAVEDAASGTLTAQGAEALRTLYPLLFQEVQVSMLDALRGMRRPSYAVANQLSLLMNTPADVTHTEHFVFLMQQNYAQTGQQEQSQRAPRHVLRTNNASATSSQSMEIRLR